MIDVEETIERSLILGVSVSACNLDETVGKFCDWIDSDQKKRVCVLPVNCLLWADKDATLKEIYNSADLGLADGVPVVWASKFLGKPVRGRVTGLDLLPAFASVAAKKGYSFFLLGAKPGIAAILADFLTTKYPGLKIVGHYSPPMAERFAENENLRICEKINRAKPNVLWVSLTAPKQDIWIYDNMSRFQTNIAIGVGGAFEVTAGLIPRSPKWMQAAGLEWLFRFMREPRRMFKRYFIEAPRFVPLVLVQKLRDLRRER